MTTESDWSDVGVPEIDLENGLRLNRHAYAISPTYRAMIDQLRAQDRAQEQRAKCVRWLRAATMLRDGFTVDRVWPTLEQVLTARRKEGL